MIEKAIFAAGCFWGIESGFSQLEGVTSTEVGYIGGSTDNPTYKDVCAGTTNHAEAVLVEYDSDKISFDELLNVFWEIHDPTQLNRQGPDVGTQYRSAIFCLNEEQKDRAEASKKEVGESGRFSKKIVTEIVPADLFWKAEEYHQKYLLKRGLFRCH